MQNGLCALPAPSTASHRRMMFLRVRLPLVLIFGTKWNTLPLTSAGGVTLRTVSVVSVGVAVHAGAAPPASTVPSAPVAIDDSGPSVGSPLRLLYASCGMSDATRARNAGVTPPNSTVPPAPVGVNA